MMKKLTTMMKMYPARNWNGTSPKHTLKSTPNGMVIIAVQTAAVEEARFQRRPRPNTVMIPG